jgi:uncharacterized membrane protein
MAREEMIVGLQNAINRGESMERAMQSLISAGYPPEDVQSAAGAVNMGTAGTVGAVESQKSGYEDVEQAKAQLPKKKKTGMLILLTVILLLLIGGIIAFFYFRSLPPA